MIKAEPSWPRTTMIVLNILLLVTGCILFSCSTWLSSLPDHQIHLTLFYPLFSPLKMTLTTFGVLLVISSAVGLLAAARVSRYSTALWMLLLFLLLVSESVLTVLFLIHQRPVLHHLLALLLHMMQTDYGNDEEFTKGMNFLQQKLQCCGLLHSGDYSISSWASTSGLVVPLTCCKLINSRSSLAWKNPQPENIHSCQETVGRLSTRFQQGCFDPLLSYAEPFADKGLCALIVLVCIQVVGILVSFSLCRIIDRKQLCEQIS